MDSPLANWFPDFPHPANFAVTVSGATRQPTNSPNYGQVHDQEIDRLIERAGRIDDLAASEAIYQRIDELLRRRAYVAAYGSRRLLKIASRRIDFAALRASSVYGLDLTSLRLR